MFLGLVVFVSFLVSACGGGGGGNTSSTPPFSYSLIHSFTGTSGDGAIPWARLVYYSANGIYYGTAASGGTYGRGTIFEFNPQTNNEATIYSFKTSGDGHNPDSYPAYDPVNGMFYGLTIYGGIYNGGTIFEFNPQNNANPETVLYSFGSVPGDGTNPPDAFTYDPANGMFYGTCWYGGIYNGGTIFEFNPQNNANPETVLYSFGSVPGDAAGSQSVLTYYSVNGKFYGTTPAGGANGNGTIFEFDPQNNANPETVLYSFPNSPVHGKAPYGAPVYDPANGLFYGTTSGGGADSAGTVYNFNPVTNNVTTLYSFTNTAGDGANPTVTIAYDSANGMFYGTTQHGGTNGNGTIFEFNPVTNEETPLYSFGSASSGDPVGPYLSPVYDPANETFYVTSTGGGADGKGTIFEFIP